MGPARRLPAPSQVVTVPNSKVPLQQQPSTSAGTLPVATCTSQSAATSYQLGIAEKLIVPSTSPQSTTQIVKPVTGHVTPSCRCAAVDETQRNGGSVIQTTQQPSEQQATSICTSCTFKSTSSSPPKPLCSSITTLTPVSSTAPSSVASSSSATHPVAPLSTPATAFHARFGRTSKYATKDSPRTFGVKCVVDFERIYHYLSVIHKPNMDCHLTPMGMLKIHCLVLP